MKGEFVDYSVLYREKEMKQLNKRLRKTRLLLLIAAAAFLAGGFLFWIMPESLFTVKNLIYYVGMSLVLAALAFFSKRKPYRCLLTALVGCIGYWGIEILLGNMENLLVEGTIHKLCIISLLISGMHTSKEAELIKKELNFS
jgi:hypothetical protein